MIRDQFSHITNRGKRWQLRNRKRYLAYCKQYNIYRKSDPILSKRKHINDLTYARKTAFIRAQKRREEKAVMFTQMGGKCVKCNFSDIRALQLDHVFGDGYKDRKHNYLRYTPKAKKELLEKHQAGILQILCANCNWIKKFNNNETARNRITLEDNSNF